MKSNGKMSLLNANFSGIVSFSFNDPLQCMHLKNNYFLSVMERDLINGKEKEEKIQNYLHI